MTTLKKKNSKKTSTPAPIKKSNNSVWQMVRHKANDNTPPLAFWFYKILILSLILFGIIELVSMLLKI